MSYRYTVETIASGQPRAYADTINHSRVTFEKREEWRGSTEWEPCAGMKEEAVREMLRVLKCGFTDFVRPTGRPMTMEEVFTTRLDWLRETEPGVWEFHTTSEYTD